MSEMFALVTFLLLKIPHVIYSTLKDIYHGANEYLSRMSLQQSCRYARLLSLASQCTIGKSMPAALSVVTQLIVHYVISSLFRNSAIFL